MYKSATKTRNNTQDILADQIDYGRKKQEETPKDDAPLDKPQRGATKTLTFTQNAIYEWFLARGPLGKAGINEISMDVKCVSSTVYTSINKLKRFGLLKTDTTNHKAGHMDFTVVKQPVVVVRRKGQADDIHLSKICEHCKKTYHRRQDESMTQWETRRFCGRKCSNVNKAKSIPEQSSKPSHMIGRGEAKPPVNAKAIGPFPLPKTNKIEHEIKAPETPKPDLWPVIEATLEAVNAPEKMRKLGRAFYELGRKHA